MGGELGGEGGGGDAGRSAVEVLEQLGEGGLAEEFAVVGALLVTVPNAITRSP